MTAVRNRLARLAGRRAAGSVERVLKRSMDRGAIAPVATLRRNSPRVSYVLNEDTGLFRPAKNPKVRAFTVP